MPIFLFECFGNLLLINFEIQKINKKFRKKEERTNIFFLFCVLNSHEFQCRLQMRSRISKDSIIDFLIKCRFLAMK
jgi:hypothetical protein